MPRSKLKVPLPGGLASMTWCHLPLCYAVLGITRYHRISHGHHGSIVDSCPRARPEAKRPRAAQKA